MLLLLFGAENIQAQISRLFPIEIKGKWGYMDNQGKMIIDAQYDMADDFKDGYAVVALNNLPCVIDFGNKRVIDTGLYRIIGYFSEGLSCVRDYQNHFFYIDSKGTKVIRLSDSIYDARPFMNGVAVVANQFDRHEIKFEVDISTIGFRFAYINKKGNYITPFIYDDADDMQDGIARVKKGTVFGLIDTSGTEIVKPVFSLLDEFFEGKAAANANGKWGYINRKGEWVIPAQFDLTFDFNEGMAGFWLKGKYGFIDHTGKVAVPAQFEQIRAFSEGKAAVQKDGKWGFINTKGETVIPFNYDNATVFSEGMCAVVIKRHWGFIGSAGNLTVSPEFDAVGSFEDGVADAVYHGISLYINKSGDVLPKLNR